MHAWRVHRRGEPGEVFQLDEIPAPTAADLEGLGMHMSGWVPVQPGIEPFGDWVILQMTFAALALPDVTMARGSYPVPVAMPYVSGQEGVGVVTDASPMRRDLLGTRVAAVCIQPFGSLAPVSVGISTMFAVPDSMSDEDAAAFMIPAHTAWHAVHRRGKIQSGEAVVVMGAAGGLGAAIVQLCVAAGCEVFAVVGAAEKAGVVSDLGAQAIVGAANRSPISTFESNIRGTYILLEACRLNDTVQRIVVASSDKAYGSNPTLPYREGLPLQGVFPYDVSKSCTDLLARSFAVTYDMPVAVTRSANIYGPADLNLSRIIPGTIISVLRNEDPVVRSDGTPIREFVHTDDVCSAYLMLAEKIDDVRGEAFNIGTNESVQILDLTNKIIELAGASGRLKPEVLLKHKIEHEIDAQYLSADKIREKTGWSSTVSLENGLRQTIEWYNHNIERLR